MVYEPQSGLARIAERKLRDGKRNQADETTLKEALAEFEETIAKILCSRGSPE